jgi:hypothetical protein
MPIMTLSAHPADFFAFLTGDFGSLVLQLQLFKWLMIARLLHTFRDQFALHRRIQCSDY